jgi:tetratricopeptide (TPR) repeat protein
MLLLTRLAFAAGQAEFDAGNTAYAAGDLAGAEAKYREALTAGAIDADAYFNLGNVLWRQDKVAPAILAWRTAEALSPRDPDVGANLDFARRKVKDPMEPVRPVPVWAPWQNALTPDEGQWVGGALAGLGLIAIALRGRLPHAPIAAIGALLTALGLLFGAGALVQARMPVAAVVLAAQTTARSDLGGGVDLFTLHAGAEVRTVQRAGEHVLIALPDERKGWVPRADVGLVDPTKPFPS